MAEVSKQSYIRRIMLGWRNRERKKGEKAERLEKFINKRMEWARKHEERCANSPTLIEVKLD